MSFQQLIGIALLCGFCIGTLWALYDIGDRLKAIEAEQKQHAAFIRIAMDSINELANPAGGITIENTVEERHP